MNAAANENFTQQIHPHLEQKLRTQGGDGAAETHGVCAGLICCGVTSETLAVRAALFPSIGEDKTSSDNLAVIEGVFGLAERALQSDAFDFTPLLPPDDAHVDARMQALIDWCRGFITGISYEREARVGDLSSVGREALDAIQRVGGAESANTQTAETQAMEKDLLEMTEFVRVAAQILYAELRAP